MSLPPTWIRERRLPGDASSRQYSRVTGSNGRTAILARYPHDVRGQLGRDLEVRGWCGDHGLRVPELLDHDLDEGWAVLEDFGPDDAEHTLARVSPAEREELGRRVIDPLVALSMLDPARLPGWNLPLDRQRLRWELAGFELWFLRHRLGVPPPATVGAWLDELAAVIEDHPKRVCHRDYHLNNLFLLSSGEVGLIDFQDILIGPDTYDAVSLLGERGIPHLVSEDGRHRLQDHWAATTHASDGWRERWLCVRVQRGLKVLGTFARLAACGAVAYDRWVEKLAGDLDEDLRTVGAPSELTDLLLDLCRRHQ